MSCGLAVVLVWDHPDLPVTIWGRRAQQLKPALELLHHSLCCAFSHIVNIQKLCLQVCVSLFVMSALPCLQPLLWSQDTSYTTHASTLKRSHALLRSGDCLFKVEIDILFFSPSLHPSSCPLGTRVLSLSFLRRLSAAARAETFASPESEWTPPFLFCVSAVFLHTQHHHVVATCDAQPCAEGWHCSWWAGWAGFWPGGGGRPCTFFFGTAKNTPGSFSRGQWKGTNRQ